MLRPFDLSVTEAGSRITPWDWEWFSKFVVAMEESL